MTKWRRARSSFVPCACWQAACLGSHLRAALAGSGIHPAELIAYLACISLSLFSTTLCKVNSIFSSSFFMCFICVLLHNATNLPCAAWESSRRGISQVLIFQLNGGSCAGRLTRNNSTARYAHCPKLEETAFEVMRISATTTVSCVS